MKVDKDVAVLFPNKPKLARALALAMTALFPLIVLKGKLTPHKHLIDQASGDVYMERYRLVDEKPFTRTIIRGGVSTISVPNDDGRQWSARLHHIMRPDHDRDLHNHPFKYRTYVLRGWYDEVYIDAAGAERTRRISAGQTAYSGGTFHRIAAVSPGGVWTVFVMSQNTGRWGFRVRQPSMHGRPRYKFIESRAYFDMRANGPVAS